MSKITEKKRLDEAREQKIPYEEYGDGQKIFYIERWQAKEDMYQHIRSNLYLRVLNAIGLANEPPEIYFHEDSKKNGH